MKKKRLFPLVMTFLSLCVSSCSSLPKLAETPDGYVDVLPYSHESATILQAFNWSFKQIEENLPAISNAGFKVVQTSPVQQPKSGGSSWWSFYQPLSFSIADNSPLGDKDDLKSLCDEAEKHNISIICDVILNHMANINDDEKEADGTPKVDPAVYEYEPYLYEHRNDSGMNATFHHNPKATGCSQETQFYQWGNLPDLNTANPYVQERCVSLLKECIDVGVDGFRIDTAKHIETPNDPQNASDFWPNVIHPTKDYYKDKTGHDLFIYGEILGDPIQRSISQYTTFMKVTSDGYSGNVRSGLYSKDPERIINSPLRKDVDATNQITWVDSHDTYISSSSHLGEANNVRIWAILASRKGTSPLFLARPSDGYPVATVGSYQFESEEIAVINRFHNRFINAEEEQHSTERIYINERFDEENSGAILVNLDTEGDYNVTLSHFKDGIYYNQLTGEQVSVRSHKAKIHFDKSGVVVLTMSKNSLRPTISISKRSTSFVGDMSVTINVTNAADAYVVINQNEPRHFSKTITIKLNDYIDSDGLVNLTIFASNGLFRIDRHFVYEKMSLLEGGFNIFNLNMDYLNDYSLYYWAWNGDSSSWFDNYVVEDNVILIDFSKTTYTGFLLALFPKGYIVTKLDKWDNNVIKQTSDISISAGFFDASGF